MTPLDGAGLVNLSLGVDFHPAGPQAVARNLVSRLVIIAVGFDGWRGRHVGESDTEIFLVGQDIGDKLVQNIVAALGSAQVLGRVAEVHGFQRERGERRQKLLLTHHD